MGRLTDMFAGKSVSACVERARRKMAAGKLEDAYRVIEKGLERFPNSTALMDLNLSIRRARAHSKIRQLEMSIESHQSPRAFEELVKLYQDLELPAEALRRAAAYAENHPELDSPHLMLGSMYLEMFFEELRARHGHKAHEHLLRAAALNPMAIQPRLLLAELYFCIDARRSLSMMMRALEQMSPDQNALEPARAAVGDLEDAEKEDSLEGIFERIEVHGALSRAPELWPLSKRQKRGVRVQEDNADPAVQELVASGAMDELVLLRRDGTVLSHATPTGMRPPEEDEDKPAGLVDVVRTVATKVYPQAREFDLGKFERCTIKGSFGNLVIGRVGNVLTGARTAASVEPHRLWDRLRMELEGGSGEGTP